MQSLHIGSNWNSTNLAEVELRVLEINALIDQQRELIEKLAEHGCDITSAKIIFDSLLVSLSLYVQGRHQLRSLLNARKAEAIAA
jgi:hypothetical protein